MRPHLGKELADRTYLMLLGTSVLVTLGAWAAVTAVGLVNVRLLPTPAATIAAGWELLRNETFVQDVLASLARVGVGFLLSIVVGVPIGLLAGSHRPTEALLMPLLGVFRYLPAAAFIPLTILWLGIGTAQKVSIIFISIVFYLTLMVADVARSVRREWIETVLTLGARPPQVLLRVVVPASLPGVWDSLRTMMGVGWTTIIIAELVNADVGLGARIQVASRFLRTDQILFVVLVIGLIGLLLDWAFRVAGRALFSWSQR